MLSKIEISRPDNCEDCPFSYEDSDHGSTCNHSGESINGFDDISENTIPIFCAFNENQII